MSAEGSPIRARDPVFRYTLKASWTGPSDRRHRSICSGFAAHDAKADGSACRADVGYSCCLWHRDGPLARDFKNDSGGSAWWNPLQSHAYGEDSVSGRLQTCVATSCARRRASGIETPVCGRLAERSCASARVVLRINRQSRKGMRPSGRVNAQHVRYQSHEAKAPAGICDPWTSREVMELCHDCRQLHRAVGAVGIPRHLNHTTTSKHQAKVLFHYRCEACNGAWNWSRGCGWHTTESVPTETPKDWITRALSGARQMLGSRRS